MEDFIIKLENMLRRSGYENWKTYYFPDWGNEFILELDGDTILMTKLDEDHPFECPKYYRWCNDCGGGIVVATSVDDAKEKLQKKYGLGEFKIWSWENDDYYDECNPDVFDIYGI